MTDPPVWPTVAVTAHRPEYYSRAQADWAAGKLADAAAWCHDLCATTTAYSGLARGGDMWWADAALAAGMALHAWLPFPKQAELWTPGEKDHWQRLVDRAARVVTVTAQEAIVTRGAAIAALHTRNRRMLDEATAVVCVYLPGTTSGGTFNAIQYANRRRLPGVWIDPAGRRVRRGLPPVT